MKQRYRYTIILNSDPTGFTEFDGEVYYYEHAEGIWRFSDEGGNELVVNGSELIYFTVEPLSLTVAEASV